MKKPVIVSVCGKGGVGKTSISALCVKIFSSSGLKVLAIDADPASGLATALAVDPGLTVDKIRTGLTEKNGKAAVSAETLRELEYEMFSALRENGNIAFLAIGRPEKEGCYCAVNSLLRDIISDIAAGFDLVVIDAEAGIEQVNRRVMESVTHLLLVSDISLKGKNVAETIAVVAAKALRYEKAGLLLNRVSDSVQARSFSQLSVLPFLGFIPEDPLIRDFDTKGRSFLEAEDSAALSDLGRIIPPFLGL